jgi:hypothetical protein
MTERDTFGLFQWDGLYGDFEGDQQEIYEPHRRRRACLEFEYTPLRRCVRCDGYMVDWRRFARVSQQQATECHHCRGQERCEAGKHYVQTGKGCAVCEVFGER